LPVPASDKIAKDRVSFLIFVENDENTSILGVMTIGGGIETDINPLLEPT
jgi:hypothetical protein